LATNTKPVDKKDDSTVICPICNFFSFSKTKMDEWERHFSQHTNEEMYQFLSRTNSKYKEFIELSFKRFSCDRCGKCCFIPVELKPTDIMKMSKWLNISERKFLREYTEVRGDDKVYLKHPCKFFVPDEKGLTYCSIYSMRPEICRQFPFSVSLDLYLHVYENCLLSKQISEFVKTVFEIKTLIGEEAKEMEKDFIDPKKYSLSELQVGSVTGKCSTVQISFMQIDKLLNAIKTAHP
jgi:Fe-S-cluster containining protein